MPRPGKTPQVILSEAIVTAINTEDRLVDIQWHGKDRTRHNVIVTSPPGSLSFPDVGDVGLVLSVGVKDYFIGKIEYKYRNRQGGKDVDPTTGETRLVKNVAEGAVFLANVVRKTWLSLSNSGNFELVNGSNDGLSYSLKNRLLNLAGQVVKLVGSGTTVAFGYVMRDIGMGPAPIPSDAGPTIPAVEGMINILFQKLKLARFHIGHVKDPTLGIDEFSTLGGRLRAILEVCLAGVPFASLKMDEMGNVELTSSSPAGQVILDAALPTASIKLGGIGAVHPVPFGDSLLIWLNTHTHPTAVGPSGPPVVPADPSLLSLKVMTG